MSTIGQAQETATLTGSKITLEAKGRHDPCVLPRTPPLVEGMAALVLADAALMQRTRLGGACTTLSDGRSNFEPWREAAQSASTNGEAKGETATQKRARLE